MERETIIHITYAVIYFGLFIGYYFTEDDKYSNPLKSENPDYA